MTQTKRVQSLAKSDNYENHKNTNSNKTHTLTEQENNELLHEKCAIFVHRNLRLNESDLPTELLEFISIWPKLADHIRSSIKDSDTSWSVKQKELNFEHQIDRPMEIAVSPCKQRAPENDWTNTGQNQTELVATDPNLAKIIETWPLLSDELRKAIIKMIS